jgi:hypothetical protein
VIPRSQRCRGPSKGSPRRRPSAGSAPRDDIAPGRGPARGSRPGRLAWARADPAHPVPRPCAATRSRGRLATPPDVAGGFSAFRRWNAVELALHLRSLPALPAAGLEIDSRERSPLSPHDRGCGTAPVAIGYSWAQLEQNSCRKLASGRGCPARLHVTALGRFFITGRWMLCSTKEELGDATFTSRRRFLAGTPL